MFSGQNMIRLRTRNNVIGGLPDINYQQNVQHVDFGASLYLFSDGVYEITIKNGSLWRLVEFESILANLHVQEGKTIENLYNHTLNINKGEAFEDDYTILKVTFP